MMELDDHLNYISRRVCISGIVGALSGTFIGLYRGHDSIFRTATRNGISCWLVGTACFTLERCANVGITQYLFDDTERIELYNNPKKQYYVKIFSHLIGGALGGAFVNSLYSGKLIRGALVFAPIMGLIAISEEKVVHLIRNTYQIQQLQQQEQIQQSKP